MLATLHGYILRDLLKTFGLMVVALTGLFTMAGALYNVIRYEGLTGADLIYIVPFLLPVAITLALPVSALFAATSVYGRLAADNELTACRAAGINVHRLFLAVILLSVLVALLTTFSVNFIIPDFVKRIDRYARANIGQFAYQQLRTRGFIRFDKQKPHEYLVTSEGVQTVSDQVLVDHGFERPEAGLSYFWIEKPRLLVMEGENVSRFATAAGGLCMFDTRVEPVKLAVTLSDAQILEYGRRSIRFNDQKIEFDLNIQVPLKPWLVDLNTLIRWMRTPWDGSEIEKDVTRFLRRCKAETLASDVLKRVADGQAISLLDGDGRTHEISVRSASIEQRRVLASDVRVTVVDTRGRPSRFEAPKAVLSVQDAPAIAVAHEGEAGAGDNAADEAPPQLALRLLETPQRPVVQISGSGRQETRQNRKDVSFEALSIPPDILASAAELTPQAILSLDSPPSATPALQKAWSDVRAKTQQFSRRVAATMHVRLGLSASALVTVLMGALLGVMSRGSHALAAFFWSCIPMAAVVTLISVTGYPMAQRAGTTQAGIALIWGSLAGLGLVNLILLRVGIAR